MSIVSRDNVIWFGKKLRTSQFERRRLSLTYPDTLSHTELITARAIIVKYEKYKHNKYRLLIEDVISNAVDYGILLYIVLDDDESVNRVLFILRNIYKGEEPLKIPPYVLFRLTPPLYEVAETIARHDPGPAPKSALTIKPGSGSYLLDANSELLLKRCFHDCTSILMHPLVDGRSEAQVFSVHAVFDDALAGPRPLPFFVKIDSKRTIQRELQNYELYTSHFIPFNLRPNIERERCIIGHDKGVLVGNFVEQSESLWDVIRRGNAQQVIYSLFDNALRGWRMQRQVHDTQFAIAMSDKPADAWRIFDPARVSPERFDQAKIFGATKSPHELKDILLSLPSLDINISPMHADFHAGNIRVRGTDPILIDFASTRRGPMLADPASLEISLAFEVASIDDDNETWMKLMNVLYDYEFLTKPLPPPLEPRPREWLWTAIRQIRLIALADQISPFEYRLALVTFLLRRSMYTRDSEAENFRFGYAYFLGEKLLLKLQENMRERI